MNKEELMGMQMRVCLQSLKNETPKIKKLVVQRTSQNQCRKGGRPQFGETYEEYKKRKGLE